MAILIKDIKEFPKTCMDCSFCKIGLVDKVCHLTNENLDIHESWNSRSDHCPLVKVNKWALPTTNGDGILKDFIVYVPEPSEYENERKCEYV